jgi:hypothetical protein
MVRPMKGTQALLLKLTSFTAARPQATREDWRALPQLAAPHGVGPLIAYQVEYRLAGAGAPPEVRDALLSHYQGAIADNVYKFVNLKKLLAECPDRPAVLLDAAAAADALYPHVAFRPVHELRIWVRASDLAAVQKAFAEAGYPVRPNDDELGGQAINSDDRTRVVIHTRLFPEARQAEETALWERKTLHRAFGANAYRPEMEDAFLTSVLLMARAGFDTPLLHVIDLREFVRGSPDLAGPYSRPLDRQKVLDRARALKLERALWVAMELVGGMYPELAETAHALQPALRGASQALLRTLVIQPALDLTREQGFRGAKRIRTLLSGG